MHGPLTGKLLKMCAILGWVTSGLVEALPPSFPLAALCVENINVVFTFQYRTGGFFKPSQLEERNDG